MVKFDAIQACRDIKESIGPRAEFTTFIRDNHFFMRVSTVHNGDLVSYQKALNLMEINLSHSSLVCTTYKKLVEELSYHISVEG